TLGRLGQGGMGTVYAAFDRERGLKIAVKSLTASLQTMDAERLRMFKQEFRAVQDLQHPNLVQLGELFEEEGHWFFTMELVEGIDFLSFVRTAPAEPAEEVTSDVDVSEHSPRTGGATAMLPRTTIAASAKFNEMRLRSALAQLTHGLRTLHRHGKVHRDIKPSNLMVTEAGRLVILDFGIASDLKQNEEWAESRTIGTIQYMAPEQAAGQAVSPAADWYSVGVVLYQVLTGQLPFSGTGEEILAAIQHREPTPVHELVPSVPYDLARLCTDLLSRDPSVRPTPEQILDRLQ
ncbi:MAG: serine/threonine protein kinase, partial [Planctomyces sp.]|nr:serine/threonine protein kinase [Planctomyces sp.]